MKVAEIRKKSDSDLNKLLQEKHEQIRSLRFKVAAKEVKNHQLLKATRKDIARILTIIKERQHNYAGRSG